MPSYFEAYGLVFIEALVYGLPCIGRNKFEMKEFIQNDATGYLIENDDVDDLAKKMFDLLNNTRIINNVRTKRQQYIQEYSWNSVAQRIYRIMLNNENGLPY